MSDSEVRVHFRVIRYLYEAGLKLHLESVPLATASTLYHKFFRQNQLKDYDPFLIGASCLSLACKTEEIPVKLRDIVNVCYRTVHKNKAPLEIDDQFWALRESIASCELYLLRALNFRVVFDHPHKYMCHYLKSLMDWLDKQVVEGVPLARTAWSLLRDSYHCSMCLDYRPEHIAVALIYLALQTHGVEVPLQKHAKTKWWQVFCEGITLEIVQDILTSLMNMYDVENTLGGR